MILLRIILLPVSLLYSLIIFARNKMYDFGIFKLHKISVPVISIGNITTGGTGKTPLTVFIAKHYLDRDLKVGIVSRGYKRKTKDIVIVCDGISVNQDTEMSGDEPVMMSNELISSGRNKFFAAAGSDRVRTSRFLISKFNPDIIILDDGFQHRRIIRDLDIVLIDAQDYINNKFKNLFTLPSGNLRENIYNLNRADIIIQNDKSGNLKLISGLSEFSAELISIRYKSEYFMDFKNSIFKDTECRGKRAFIFSGLADNQSFFDQINQSGMILKGFRNFPDHHDYKLSDIDSLISEYETGIMFVTTEKDFTKIKKFGKFVSEFPVYFLKIGIEVIDKNNILINKLNAVIK